MAQEGKRRRGGMLAQRFGIIGRAGVAAAVVALLALGVVALAARDALGGGVVVERAEAASETGESSSAEGDVEPAGAGDDDGPPTGDAGGEEIVAPEPATLVVHVDGAVGAPGVYELPASSRVNDAVLAAGGLSAGADTSDLNLAAPLSDGEKVHVPLEGETAAPASGGAATGASDDGGPVNINTAGVEELDELPGVGEATARAIVEDRERNGPFSAPEDLMRVSGIGEKKFAKLEGLVCVR